MEIYNIKIINGGLKGLEVSYTEERKDGNGRKFVDDITKEKNDPTHFALDRPINDLRIYLLEICGIVNDSMSKPEIDQAIAETEVTAIKMMKTFFILEGEKEWLNNKRFKLKSPKIEAKDNYPSFSIIMDLLMEIRKEAEIHMKGTAVVSPEEIAVRWLSSSKNKQFTKDEFDNMTTEERVKFYKEYIENEVGGVVILQEDTLPVTEDETPEVSEEHIDLTVVSKTA